MWHVYRIELYPHVGSFGSGIPDEHGNELEFPAAFRRSRRDGRPAGAASRRLAPCRSQEYAPHAPANGVESPPLLAFSHERCTPSFVIIGFGWFE